MVIRVPETTETAGIEAAEEYQRKHKDTQQNQQWT
jgi:hypothetical protein